MLIGSNNKLRKSKIWQWTIPALSCKVNGRHITTCPNAGDCAKICYARQGCYNFSNVKVAHTNHLDQYFCDRDNTRQKLTKDIKSRRNMKAFRIHDAGDFFNITYARWWFNICQSLPHVQFYSYTKMVSMFKETLLNEIPNNLTLIYSYGGIEDHLINDDTDRHSKIFHTVKDCIEAGYPDCSQTDDFATDPSQRKIGLIYHGQKKIPKDLNIS
jgi:hypothetical protein